MGRRVLTSHAAMCKESQGDDIYLDPHCGYCCTDLPLRSVFLSAAHAQAVWLAKSMLLRLQASLSAELSCNHRHLRNNWSCALMRLRFWCHKRAISLCGTIVLAFVASSAAHPPLLADQQHSDDDTSRNQRNPVRHILQCLNL